MNNQDIKSKLENDGFVISEFSGKSMFPLLKQKTDKLVIRKDNNNIKRLDIVLYKVKDKYILHRVIGIDGDTLLIRGDNMLLTEHVNINNISGVLVGFYNSKHYVDIDDKINKKYYYLSVITYPFRKIKHIIGKLIRN